MPIIQMATCYLVLAIIATRSSFLDSYLKIGGRSKVVSQGVTSAVMFQPSIVPHDHRVALDAIDAGRGQPVFSKPAI
ncbi:hypothetical protein GGR51DRAFT_138637 [Nemania sp. FL0031]|nr:hypothetical protein GGR51DRAFT_138637 [Nemania sp. FL0031]